MILKDDGTAFKTELAAKSAMTRQDIDDAHTIKPYKDGFAIFAKDEKVIKMKKYRVHRSNVDPDNRDLIITVTANSIANRKVFWPGEEVELSSTQVDILKNSIEEIKLVIPPESGIYLTANPVTAAQSQYPDMSPEIDRSTNTISMVKRIPNYVIETIG